MANHHYAPQFYLRNFAYDDDQHKVTAVKKQGNKAIWKSCSIRSLGSTEDLYTLSTDSHSASLEGVIERNVETPLSQTKTWQKISAGAVDLLDVSDKLVIYVLIRHLNTRTPHYRSTMEQLSGLSHDPAFVMADDERAWFQSLKVAPETGHNLFIDQASSLDWTVENFERSSISIFRTKVRLKTATNPVYNIGIPDHPGLYLPVPGMTPHMSVLPLTPYSMAVLVMGDIGNDFENIEIDDAAALGFNRQRLGQFVYFPSIEQLICDRGDVVDEMAWAGFSVQYQTDKKVVFSRNE